MFKNEYIDPDLFDEITAHVTISQNRYGNFASTHEALGVALEEWNELQHAIQANAIESIREEAIDLAAVLIRLAEQCRTADGLKARSMK
jgi:NTP pyrophosphatase (non-canonical NTP hydrolase)